MAVSSWGGTVAVDGVASISISIVVVAVVVSMAVTSMDSTSTPSVASLAPLGEGTTSSRSTNGTLSTISPVGR